MKYLEFWKILSVKPYIKFVYQPYQKQVNIHRRSFLALETQWSYLKQSE